MQEMVDAALIDGSRCARQSLLQPQITNVVLQSTDCGDAQGSHDLLPKFAAQLAQLGYGQLSHQGRHAVQGDHCLLCRLVHARCQLGQDLVVSYT